MQISQPMTTLCHTKLRATSGTRQVRYTDHCPLVSIEFDDLPQENPRTTNEAAWCS